MRGRPSLFDNEAIIKSAQQVFWKKGYTATSLEDVLQAMQIGSGSFYNAFSGGKKELFRKVIAERKRAFKQFSEEVEQSADPIELIKDFFRSLASADVETNLRGCIIANTVTEMTFVDVDLEKEAVEILKEVELLYTKTIQKAQATGMLKTKTHPELLGRYLISFYNGINVTRRMYPNKEQLMDLIEFQLSIIS